MSANEILNMLYGIIHTTGLYSLGWKMVVMWSIGGVFLYLAIVKQFEPLLLLPIGFGIILVNFPLVPLMGFTPEGRPELLQVFTDTASNGRLSPASSSWVWEQ